MTKKMTKTEAFEYLKGKKVYVNEHTILAQEKLFEIGFAWRDFGTLTKRYDPDVSYSSLFMSENGEIWYAGSYTKAEEITLKDLLSIQIKGKKVDIREQYEKKTNDNNRLWIPLEERKPRVGCFVLMKNEEGFIAYACRRKYEDKEVYYIRQGQYFLNPTAWTSKERLLSFK